MHFLTIINTFYCIWYVEKFTGRITHKIITRDLIVYSKIYPTKCNVIQFIYIWKLLYMFRVVSPPIIRSTHNCIYSIWYLSNRYCYLPLPTVEQFPDINKLCNVASCWIYIRIYLRMHGPLNVRLNLPSFCIQSSCCLQADQILPKYAPPNRTQDGPALESAAVDTASHQY